MNEKNKFISFILVKEGDELQYKLKLSAKADKKTKTASDLANTAEQPEF